MQYVDGDGRRNVMEIDLHKRGRPARIGQHSWDTVGYWIVLYAQSKEGWVKFTVEELCDFSAHYTGMALRPALIMHSTLLYLFADLMKAGHLSCAKGSLYDVTVTFAQYQLVC